jgi:hypothetical protein
MVWGEQNDGFQKYISDIQTEIFPDRGSSAFDPTRFIFAMV